MITKPRKPLPFSAMTAIGLLVILDALTKQVVRCRLSPGDSISLMGNFLRITYIQNFTGFSWWVPNLPDWVTYIFQGILALIVLGSLPVYLFYIQTRRRSIWTDLALIGITAGSLGHLVEDLFLPFTTDFIQVLGSPSANFDDLYAYVGVLALAIEIVYGARARKMRQENQVGFWNEMISTRKEFIHFVSEWFRSWFDS